MPTALREDEAQGGAGEERDGVPGKEGQEGVLGEEGEEGAPG